MNSVKGIALKALAVLAALYVYKQYIQQSVATKS